jgi:hypothetical protein
MHYSESQAADSIALNGASSYLLADFWGLVALISILVSIIPLGLLLLKTPMFKMVVQPMPEFNERTHAKGPKWWLLATFNAALGTLLYFFFSDNNWAVFDDGDGGLISGVFDSGWLKTVSNNVFNMTIANGLVMFLLMAVIATLVLYLVWWLLVGKKNGSTIDDLGIGFGRKSRKEIFETLIKIAGIVSILFFYLYAVTYTAMFLGQVELRGPWSFLRVMSVARYEKFWVYFWPILIYWLVCGGMYMFGQMRQGDADKEWKTDLYWYLKICFMMLAGHGVLLAIAYFPPLWNLSAFPFIGNASWPMEILQLLGLVWGFMFLYLIAMFFFRKTGNIYLGSIICAVIGTWLTVTAGIQS